MCYIASNLKNNNKIVKGDTQSLNKIFLIYISITTQMFTDFCREKCYASEKTNYNIQ